MTLAAAGILDDRGAFKQDCNECKHDAQLRQAYGCEGPTADAEASIELLCPACHGKAATCSHCQGEGRIVIRRCPWQIISATHVEAVMAGLRLENGILPAEGGWLDQAHTFCEIYPTVRNEIAHHRAKAQERAMKQQG